MKATESTLKALSIVDKLNGLTAARFAELMWPDSNMHRKVSNQGNGATRGKAAWLCGGSYLGKLRKAGLIRHSVLCDGYTLTNKGKELIEPMKANRRLWRSSHSLT